MKISEIISDKYKLRIPPTVYYELLADVREAEEKQEPTTKNDLGVDCISRADALDCVNIGITFCDVYKKINDLPSVTPQEPKTGHWIDTNDDGFLYHRIYKCSHCGDTVCDYPENIQKYKYCSNCGAKMAESEDT